MYNACIVFSEDRRNPAFFTSQCAPRCVPPFPTVSVVDDTEDCTSQMSYVIEHPPSSNDTKNVKAYHSDHTIADWDSVERQEDQTDACIWISTACHCQCSVNGTTCTEAG